jgi:TonB dependent receptor/Carboxypeptidase regulatory-like domain/TonB-dependent Receptor Plug Domain
MIPLLLCVVLSADGSSSPPTLGTLKGVVTDQKTGEALIEATVKVLSQEGTQVLTDIDGKYELTLPAGTYDLRVFYDVYQPRRIGQVEIKPGQSKTLNVKLAADANAVEEVVVEAKVDKRSSQALLNERKKSAVVQDSVAAQDIAKTPDVNASEAVKRVVSATVVDNKYVFVRGIGGRYSQTLLNGAELPSPEPDEAAVPLDIFPTSLLSNLTVVKTYQPDLPGTFAGGVGMIETQNYPQKLEVRLQLRTEYNSEATFKPITSSSGSPTDWLTFDNGLRRLPSAVPQDRALSRAVSSAERERVSESFANTWDVYRRTGTPAGALNAQVGNTWQLRGASKLGLLTAVSYSHRDTARLIETNTTQASNGDVVIRDQGTNRVGSETAQLGALANLAYTVNANHELNLFVLFTRNMENTSSLFAGSAESFGGTLEASRFYFVAREMTFAQLRGFHRFPRARNLELEWQGNVGLTRRQEPDVRDLQLANVGNGFGFRESPNSGERYFSTLDQPSLGAFANFTLPVNDVFKIKFGGRASYQSRRFSARRFRFETISGGDLSNIALPRSELFTPSTIGSTFLMSEFTFTSDTYDAALLVGGAYALGDVTLGRMRLIGGLRYEGATQTLTSGAPFATLKEPTDNINRVDNNVLPAANAVLTLADNMALRAAYSYTLARPKFRELASFLFYDFARRRSVTGEPELQQTRIHNVDLRWEWFPADLTVFAASVFYKNFVNPIETVVYDATDGSITFANTRGANLVGGELEARTSLGRISHALRGVTVSANFTLMWSQAVLGDEARASTNRQRPLQGQSPYVVNATIGWASESKNTEIALLYNVYGPRLAEVGFETLPDVYEQEFHRLDLNASQALGGGFRMKLSATNLAYQTIRVKQGPVTLQKYQPGINVLLALEWAM